MIDIKDRACEVLGGYFSNKAREHNWIIRDRENLFFKIALSQELPSDLVECGYRALFQRIGELIQVIFGTTYHAKGLSDLSSFPIKLQDVANMLERKIVESGNIDEDDAREFLMASFEKDEFKTEGYNYLAERLHCNKPTNSKRVYAFRKARKLFIIGLLDRITRDLWGNEERIRENLRCR